MTVKTIMTAAILTVMPALSFAMCSGNSHSDQEAMTCVEGTQWDAESATCIPVTSS